MTNNKVSFAAIPKIPQEIIDAIDNKKLLIFVGAGVSKLYGYPRWIELGSILIDKAIEEGAITYSEKDTLLNGGFSPMEIVTVVTNRFDSNCKGSGAAHIINELSDNKNKNQKLSNKIARYLSAYNSPVITTNADTSLDGSKYFADRIKLNDFADFKPGPHNSLSLIHLHGCIKEPNSLVFTIEDYSRFYNIGSTFGQNLSSLFDNKWTILFLGYGVAEFELLRYFIKYKNTDVKRLFLVQGYLNKDVVKRNLDDEFYNSLGIKLLPYSREKRDYLGLVDVLRSWDNDVRKRTLAGSITKQKIVDDIFSQPPTKESVTIINNIVNKHDDLKLIIKSVSNSEYLSKWILNLKDNEILFSPYLNIKPCIHVDEKSVRSDYWDGLTILRSYSSRNLKDKDVDAFIIKLINDAILVYQNDKETQKYKKLNSSDQTILTLLEIVISRSKYIDLIDVSCLVKTYFDSALAWPYTLVHELNKQKDVLLSSRKNKVLDVYKTILELSDERIDYGKYLDIPEIIKSYPLGYYNFAKKSILSLEDNYYDMGAFFDYDTPYIKRKDVILFNWMKTSSLFLEKGELEKDISSFVSSSYELHKKIGLCLINLNFIKEEKFFFENIHFFFNNECFYADLRMLFINNSGRIFVENNKKILCDELEKATFGLSNDSQIRVLKNHLRGIFKRNRYDTVYEEETKDARDFATNFNKAFYLVENNLVDETNKIYNSIKELSIEDAVQKYKAYKKNSSYYISIIHKAFIKYLIVKYPSDFYNFLVSFDSDLVRSLISYFSNGDGKNADLLYLTIKSALKLCNEDCRFIDCISPSLFEMRSFLDAFGKEKTFELFNLINYKWITIDEFNDFNDVINVCINEGFFAFIDLLIVLSFEYQQLKEKSIEVFNYFIEKSDNHKLKSIMAFSFPYLLMTNEEYALSKKDYVFDNMDNDINLSYPLLVLSQEYSEHLLSIIGKRNDLKKYLSFKYNRGDNLMAQTVLFNWFFMSYIKGNDSFVGIINILFETNNYSAILELIHSANYWIESNNLAELQIERYVGFLKMLFANAQKKEFAFDEVDQLIRAISKTLMLLNNKYQFLWNLLIALFKHFKSYFSDESLELIKKYKDVEFKNIVKILTLYFASYTQYFTFESTLIKVFNLMSSNRKYKAKCKEWKVLLVGKNPDLNISLKLDSHPLS